MLSLIDVIRFRFRRVTRRILYADKSIRIEFIQGHKAASTIACTFVGRQFRNMDEAGFAEKFCLDNGWDIITFKCTDDSWFQNVPREALTDVARILKVGKYRRSFTYGGSMGAFASIVFSEQIRPKFVIAMVPQFAIDQPDDRRWEADGKRIEWNWRMADSSLPSEMPIYLFYDPHHRADALQISKIKAHAAQATFIDVTIPFSGHGPAQYLRESDLLKDVISSIVEDRWDDGLFDFRATRRKSSRYMMSLAGYLASKKKMRSALIVLDHAIEQFPNLADGPRQKAKILSSMGRHRDAIDVSRNWARARPKEARRRFLLSQMLGAAGELQEAVKEAKLSVTLDATNHDFIRHLENLKGRIGVEVDVTHDG